jgi:hypothetical protein
VLVIVFALFFYSAGIFVLLRGFSVIMVAPELSLWALLHLIAMVIPPLLIGFALFTLRYWSIYILATHVALAALSVFPLMYYDLNYLIQSTLVNNIVILIILVIMVSLSSELYKSRYGILATALYAVLLIATSGIQIAYRL